MNNPEISSSAKPTGLFFGSFNPIHLGHLCIAEYMLNWGGLKEVWFIVSPQNPLKHKPSLLSATNRLDMVREAIKDDHRFRASDIEFFLPQPSYTIDTLARLGEQYPRRNFILIAGTDILPTLHKWKNYQILLNDYRFLIFPRFGSDNHPLLEHPAITLLDAPRMEISATFIRQSIKTGKTVKYFLPAGVYQLIEKWGFYL
ncbi:MAG: nicotinate-nucleotide adenylyltransferase [Lentimicrobium sp.]|jgi:nicotinate-nucleotide adenylyltransferase|nr:nicotinate-nucleotide adenylyltransferase [Lentimicrobium sp.]MDD2526973.1 nicotinate (nicotinamide) nucleotide adenylyltransferase [Lentimicrobiaceae bacterium]MDD4597831.1 nicotinate (nicotinamide) nucleotide adenylyltransferase [Lentimicrobiaceae bacterium]MDY0024987.1 nicotinate (nicotinamide) nucleotide adenylyltransferase [Lentimicrobium sp.]HAH57727.1 nicotinic acid mononucleotide adenylyltransferase [Bacteroidales bacterium]